MMIGVALALCLALFSGPASAGAEIGTLHMCRHRPKLISVRRRLAESSSPVGSFFAIGLPLPEHMMQQLVVAGAVLALEPEAASLLLTQALERQPHWMQRCYYWVGDKQQRSRTGVRE